MKKHRVTRIIAPCGKKPTRWVGKYIKHCEKHNCLCSDYGCVEINEEIIDLPRYYQRDELLDKIQGLVEKDCMECKKQNGCIKPELCNMTEIIKLIKSYKENKCIM